MNAEIKTDLVSEDKPKRDILLSIQNLRVWFELRRWALAAGYVRAVDNVSLTWLMVKTIA